MSPKVIMGDGKPRAFQSVPEMGVPVAKDLAARKLTDLDEYEEAELIAARVQSYYAPELMRLNELRRQRVLIVTLVAAAIFALIGLIYLSITGG